MDVVHPRVAGLDVQKKVIWVAVRLPGQGRGERTVIVKNFRSFWGSLQKMAATGSHRRGHGVHGRYPGYWWPVYHALAGTGSIEMCVCNAAHMRNVPGRKTDLLTELPAAVGEVRGCIGARWANVARHAHGGRWAAGLVLAGTG